MPCIGKKRKLAQLEVRGVLGLMYVDLVLVFYVSVRFLFQLGGGIVVS